MPPADTCHVLNAGSNASDEEADEAAEWKELLLAVAASGREASLRWLLARGAPLAAAPGRTSASESGSSRTRGSQLLAEAVGAADGGSLRAVRARAWEDRVRRCSGGGEHGGAGVAARAGLLHGGWDVPGCG